MRPAAMTDRMARPLSSRPRHSCPAVPAKGELCGRGRTGEDDVGPGAVVVVAALRRGRIQERPAPSPAQVSYTQYQYSMKNPQELLTLKNFLSARSAGAIPPHACPSAPRLQLLPALRLPPRSSAEAFRFLTPWPSIHCAPAVSLLFIFPRPLFFRPPPPEGRFFPSYLPKFCAFQPAGEAPLPRRTYPPSPCLVTLPTNA